MIRPVGVRHFCVHFILHHHYTAQLALMHLALPWDTEVVPGWQLKLVGQI